MLNFLNLIFVLWLCKRISLFLREKGEVGIKEQDVCNLLSNTVIITTRYYNIIEKKRICRER